MTEKVKLEDMTVGEMNNLRDEMEEKILNAIFEITNTYEDKYDLGQIGVDVETEFRDTSDYASTGVRVSFYNGERVL